MEDRDFIDFKFGDHWASDFNLLAVSSGDRYSPPVYGSVNPNTATIAGKVGVYKWKTQVNEKVFNIKIAFDNINGQILNQIKEWLNPFKIDKLVFKEEPYKYYWVALNTEPKLDFLPFLEETKVVNGIAFKEGVYKGEFELQFVCFDNYGYSDWQSFDENYDYVVKEIEGEEPISFNDGSDNNLIITKIEGNSKQETRSGKNKADINNYYYDTINYSDLNISLNNGEFTISTDGAKIVTEYIKIPIKINSNGTYMFGIDLKTNKAGDTAQALAYDYTNKKNIGTIFTNTDTNYITKTQQITINDSIDKDNIFIFLYCPTNGTVGQAYSFSYRNIFFNEGTNTEYEPYGVMPSPDYPSEIKNCKDSINIKVCNKNLLNAGLLDFEEKTINGVTIKNNHDGTYSVKGTSTGVVDLILKGDWTTTDIFLKIKKGLLCYSTNLKNTDGYIALHDHFSNRPITINANTSYNNQVVENITYTFIRLAKTSGITFNEDKVIFQLEYNSSTELIPHEEQIITFPLAEGQVLHKDDYLADDGIHHKRKQIVLTGREDGWSWADTTRYALKIDNAKDGNGLCNQFKYNEYSTTVKIDNTFNVSNGYVGFYITNITSLTAFKNYLAEQYANGTPVVVEYDLVEEEIEPYTTEQQIVYDEIKNNLYSYEGTNHIFSTDEVSPLLSISYVPKQDIYIDYVANQSNLLNDSAFYYNNNIYKKSYFDAETGDATKSGISENRPIYLYNAGTTAANLNLTFDMIIPAEGSPLVINTESCKLTDNGIQVLKQVSSISISDFSKYKPFLEIYDGTPSNWQIQIDSNLCEVYLKHKTDKTKIISLNKFNDNQSFLSLANCNFVDYSKPFPTLITAISGTALENTVFNKLSVGTSAQNYRLKNVDVEWKHTYL